LRHKLRGITHGYQRLVILFLHKCALLGVLIALIPTHMGFEKLTVKFIEIPSSTLALGQRRPSAMRRRQHPQLIYLIVVFYLPFSLADWTSMAAKPARTSSATAAAQTSHLKRRMALAEDKIRAHPIALSSIPSEPHFPTSSQPLSSLPRVTLEVVITEHLQ